MAKKGSPPPAPDYTPLIEASREAAKMSFDLGQQQLAWAKEQYERDSNTTSQVVDRFLATQDENAETARKDRARYEEKFQPLEDKLIADADSYSSAERKDLEQGRAQTAVGQQFDAKRAAATRALESFGINPGATRYAAIDAGVRAQQAAAQAQAGTDAGQRVENTGRALRSEAINVGKGYPGQIAQQYGVSQGAGGGAVSSTLAQTGSGAQTMGTGAQWTQMGMGGLGQAAGIMNTGYNNELAGWKAEQEAAGGWGTALGLVGGALMGGKKPWIFAESGGAIPEVGAPPGEHSGIPVPRALSPSGGQQVDDVKAALTVGEFVVPKDVVSWFGEQHFQKLIEKARSAKDGAPAKPEIRRGIPT